MTSFEDIENEYKKINEDQVKKLNPTHYHDSIIDTTFHRPEWWKILMFFWVNNVILKLNLEMFRFCSLAWKLLKVILNIYLKWYSLHLFWQRMSVPRFGNSIWLRWGFLFWDTWFEKLNNLHSKKSRVSECQQRVNDLLDLQLCREGVITSMKTEDFETAAAHVHRFLAIDETTVKLTAGDDTEGTQNPSFIGIFTHWNTIVVPGRTVDSSLALLHEAQNQLCRVIEQKFDEAARDQDAASVERFFKIFPLLNMHEEGIKKFSSYLATQVHFCKE